MRDARIPSVVHPKLVRIGEYTFRIVSYVSLTDEQAMKAALIFCRTHRLLKKHRKGVITVVTTFDEESAQRL